MTRVGSRALRQALAAGALLAAAGCADMGPPQQRHRLADPAALTTADGGAMPWPAERWWADFGDDALSALVERALAGQPSLQQALARVQQAAALADAAEAGAQPRLQLSADATEQRFSERGLVPPAVAGSVRWTRNLQLGASWEPDLSGRQSAALAAAIGQQRAAAADSQAARVLLAAQVATHWFALAQHLEGQRQATRALRQREERLALLRQRLAAGLDNAVEQQQAIGLVAQAQAELEALPALIARERHALAELSGQPPQALATLDAALAPVRVRPLPATLNADLLGRRADLVAQRWRVEAALHGVDGARAQFYPDINLMAFVGLSSLGLDHWLDLGARTWGAGPALRLPLFDGGRLRAQLALRGAEADTAIEGWNAALLRALREVADALAGVQALQRQQAAQDQASSAAEAARALARQRFEAGLGNLLDVLAADAAVLAQQRAALDLKARQLAAEVALTQALGGGYRGDEPEQASMHRAATRP